MPIKTWTALLSTLKISLDPVKSEDVLKIKQWCCTHIQSHFKGSSLKSMQDIVAAYVELSNQAFLGTLVDETMGYSVAHRAAKLGFDCFLEESLKSEDEANRNVVNVHSKHGHTPLHLAALFGSPETLSVLLRHQSDANLFNHAHKLPIHMTLINNGPCNKIDCFKILLPHTHPSNMLKVDDTGMSLLLSLIAYTDDLTLIKDVLERQPGLLSLVDTRRQNALHTAIIHQRHGLIDFFASQETLLLQKTDNDSTVLHLACRYGDEATLRRLMPHKACEIFWRSKDEHGATPMDYLLMNPELKHLGAEINGSTAISPDP